ncbi:guanine deaminase [Anaerococcus sp. AGMB00486]|uniref:Guanine deaminase n=1 Tax=Anaerococcus faecalis TaxID=2742993 RepID=A0ABX2NCE7_9FIRM|nr:guanine deaminase [Anaerococcus faecalis]NVF12386.1 guanine deaminase [Anaerococcus faecalis]
MNCSFALEANAYYSTSFDNVKFVESGIFLVNEEGFIEDVFEKDSVEYKSIRKKLVEDGKLRVLDDKHFIIPGFIDLHIHAPQWPQSGSALDQALEVWLNKYTFPLESKFKDLEFASEVYTNFVKQSLKFGTTTAMYFATIDVKSSSMLAKICARLGQRALVGKVVMDDKISNPSYYRDENAKDSLKKTEYFINDVLAIKDSCKQKVYPVITPRFIPSCTDEVLKGLGELAKEYKGIHIQSHVSESDWEHSYVKERFGINDSFALDSFNLLTDRTILAHGCHLSDDDMKLLADRSSSIASCPISNAYFANAVLPVKDAIDKSLNVGLATDISGGYSPSMYTAIRQAIISSRMLNDGVDPRLRSGKRGREDSSLSLNNAFYLATLAGGKALKLPVGKLEKDYAFDIQIIKIDDNIPSFYKEKSNLDLFHKAILLAESTNIEEVWIQGNRVK